MSGAARLIVAVAVVLAFFAVARAWDERLLGTTTLDEGLRGAAAGLGLLLLGSYLFGQLSKRAHLPKLSGYLLFGMLVGPSALGMVTKGQLEYLRLVNDLAIVVIALTAGGEIDLKAMLPRVRMIVSLALGVTACAGAGVFVLAASAPGLFGFELDGWSRTAAGVAALLAVLSIANSPAVLVALMTEMNARGPMAQTALAATVLKDLLLVTLFAVVFAWAAPGLGAEAHAGEGGVAARLAVEIGGSVAFGVVAGLFMAFYLHRSSRNLPAFVLLSGFAISLIAGELGFEPLLTALVAGLFMRNVWPSEAEPLFEAIEQLSAPVYCVFFAVAGAKLDLGAIPGAAAAASALIATRAAFTVLGVKLGAAAGKLDAPSRRRLWTAFMPQAGVALALASIVEESLGGQAVGDRFFTLVVVAMGVHEIVGPVLLRWGLAGDEPPQEGARVEVGTSKKGSGEGPA